MCSRNVVRPQMCRPGGTLEGPMSKTKEKEHPRICAPQFQPLETWTHEMCVLGRCDEDKTPDREQMECLLMAGLGKAKTRKQRI